MNLHLTPMDSYEYERWAQGVVKRKLVTRVQLDRMVKRANGLCEICKQPRRIVLDHNHETGRARGLLCYRCNSILGWLEKYRGIFYRALAYLRRRGVALG